MSLQRCQQETTSTEFVEWQEYARQEATEHKREDYYLAQVAAEVRRTVARYPKRVKREHFLLRYTPTGKAQQPSEEALQERAAASKAKWLALMRTRKPKETTDGDHGDRT